MNLVFRRSKSFYALCLFSGQFLRRFYLSKSNFWQTAALTERADDQWGRVESALFIQFYLLRLEIMVRYYIETRFSAELGDYSSRVILFVRVAAPPVYFLFRRREAGLTSDLIHEQHDKLTILRQHTRECDQMPLWPFCSQRCFAPLSVAFFGFEFGLVSNHSAEKKKKKGWNSFMHSSEKRKKKGRKNNFVEP